MVCFITCLQFTNAQTDKEIDFFIVNSDTTFGKDLTYQTTAQGILKSITVKDPAGKSITVTKDVDKINTFRQYGTTYDRIPFKADKPSGVTRFTARKVDGILKVYLAQQASTSGGPSGTYRFFIKFPDGTYVKINSKKNMENIIKPYLIKCSAFVSNYKGNYSTRENPFMEMITLYNSLCQ